MRGKGAWKLKNPWAYGMCGAPSKIRPRITEYKQPNDISRLVLQLACGMSAS